MGKPDKMTGKWRLQAGEVWLDKLTRLAQTEKRKELEIFIGR